MTNSKVNDVTDATFGAEVLQADQPVLVDFTAAWCPPCRALEPVLEGLAHDYQGRAKLVRLDVDAHQTSAQRFGVRALPTLLVFKGGAVVQQHVGGAPKAKVAAMLDAALQERAR